MLSYLLQSNASSSALGVALCASAHCFRDLVSLRAAHKHCSTLTQTSTEQASTVTPPYLSTCTLEVNGHNVTVPEGVSVLEACRKLGIHVPTLCTDPRLHVTPGTCRLCLVDVEGRLKPACATPVWKGMKVATDTENVRHNIRSVLTLMRANHPNDCMTCEANGRCEFQDLLTRYNIGEGLPKLRDFSHEWDEELSQEKLADDSSFAIQLNLDKCLKCGRCVTACSMVQNMNVIGFLNRGRARHPGVAGQAPIDTSKCIECGQCTAVCPVAALTEKPQWTDVLALLENKRDKVVVVQTAPAVRVAIGEEVGLAAGDITTGQMVSALRALGFDHVFDTNLGADLTIMEEGTELLTRLKHKWGLLNATQHGDDKPQHDAKHGNDETRHDVGPLPMFTSCCPAWINHVEKSQPDLIPHLSTCKSPHMMVGAVAKTYWANKVGVDASKVVVVSIMPCTAKKHEADRDGMADARGNRNVDYVLTTRELGRMLRHKRVPLASLPEDNFDNPLGESTGAADLFGATGGVMEAALRTAYELGTGQLLPKLEFDDFRGMKGIKTATIRLPNLDKDVRVAVASGIGNARHLLEDIRTKGEDFDFVEVMSCPGGCVGGGGQPKNKDPLAVLQRMTAIYDIDAHKPLRKSHENPSVQQLYSEFLEEPNGHLAHELLHTSYVDESCQTVPRKAAAPIMQHAQQHAPQHAQQ